MLRILNRYVLISFVVFLLSFVLVMDLLEKKGCSIYHLCVIDFR